MAGSIWTSRCSAMWRRSTLAGASPGVSFVFKGTGRVKPHCVEEICSHGPRYCRGARGLCSAYPLDISMQQRNTEPCKCKARHVIFTINPSVRMGPRRQQRSFAAMGVIEPGLTARQGLHAVLNRYFVRYEAVLAARLQALFDAGCTTEDLRAMLPCTAGRRGKRKWMRASEPCSGWCVWSGALPVSMWRRIPQESNYVLCGAMAPWIARCPDAWSTWLALGPYVFRDLCVL
jgi:hypothetical protein